MVLDNSVARRVLSARREKWRVALALTPSRASRQHALTLPTAPLDPPHPPTPPSRPTPVPLGPPHPPSPTIMPCLHPRTCTRRFGTPLDLALLLGMKDFLSHRYSIALQQMRWRGEVAGSAAHLPANYTKLNPYRCGKLLLWAALPGLNTRRFAGARRITILT